MSMNNKQNYWQPVGLSALQLSLRNIVEKRILGDEQGVFQGLKDFALITADDDIIKASERMAKQIEDGFNVKQAQLGITISETFVIRDSTALWLAKQNYEYMKLILHLCDTKGITVKHPREMPSNRAANGVSQLFEE